MKGELTARPSQPEVMAIPMAVAAPRGKASAISAKVVGKTGAIASPVANTVMLSASVEFSCRMAKVVMDIKTPAVKMMDMPGTRGGMREAASRPSRMPSAKP
jgi:hypothetical protein